MNPLELPLDLSEVGDMVGACVQLAPAAHAGAIDGAIVDVIFGAIAWAFLGAGAAITLSTIHIPEVGCGDEHLNTRNGWVFAQTTNSMSSASPYLGRMTIRHLLKHHHTFGITLSQLESYKPSISRPANCCTVVPPNLGNHKKNIFGFGPSSEMMWINQQNAAEGR